MVVLYGTGFGRTTPAGIDGHLASAPYPAPTLPVMLLSSGKLAYAGDAPGIVEGVTQINIVLPETHSGYVAQLQVGSITASIVVYVQ